jgi:transposase
LETTGENGRRQAVALALASGRTIRQAAATCKVGESTIYTWLKEDEFRALVSQTRSELFEQAVGRLAKRSAQAADKLARLLKGKDERVQLAAAKGILELGTKLREAGELAARVQECERLLAQSKARKK